MMKMIKIATKKDLDKICHLTPTIQKHITEDVFILDKNYGDNRNPDTDMGGFVVVCDKGEALKIVNFDIDLEVPEFFQEICPYIKKLYISGTERNIIIYERQF